jgi:hypothetical protein
MARSLALRSKSNTQLASAARRRLSAGDSSSSDSSPSASRHDGPYRNLRRHVSRDGCPAAGVDDDDRKAAAVATGATAAATKPQGRKRSNSALSASSSSTKQLSTSTAVQSKIKTAPTSISVAAANVDQTVIRAPLTRSQRKAEQVTPSPVAAQNLESTAFSFSTPVPKRKKSRVFDYSSKIPKGVVDLYPSKDSVVLTKLGNSHACCSCHQDVCSSNSLSASFIQKYGQEYCQLMKENEESIIAPSSPHSLGSSTHTSHAGAPLPSVASEDSHIFQSPVPSTGGSTVVGSSPGSQEETPHHRRVWTNVDTSNLSAVKAVESKRFLDYQPDLTPKMRAILMDWIVELSEHFNFGPSTLHLACTLVDQVLACGPLSFEDEKEEEDESRWETDDGGESKTYCFLISRERFQLLGATCTWLACKYEEQNPPEVSQIAYVSDNIYSIEQIKRMERRVCNALGWALSRQTPYPFIHEFMRASNECPNSGCEIPQTFQYMVCYLLELGRLPYTPVTKKPSLLAAAAVYLARVTLGVGGGEWTKTLEYYTGYSKDDLKEIVLSIHSYHSAAEDSSLKSAFAKYRTKKYRRVALKTVPREEDLGF